MSRRLPDWIYSDAFKLVLAVLLWFVAGYSGGWLAMETGGGCQ